MDNKDLMKLLQELHTEVAKTLLDKIKKNKATAADINAAIQLLKHDKVYAVPDTGDLEAELYNALQEEFEAEFNHRF